MHLPHPRNYTSERTILNIITILPFQPEGRRSQNLLCDASIRHADDRWCRFFKLFSTDLNYAPITLCLRVNNTHDIVRNMKLKLVLDTNVLVTAFCNQNGASHLLMRHALSDKIVLLASPALWLEYEAVLKRPQIRLRHGISLENIDIVLDTLAAHVSPAQCITLTGDIL